MLNALDISASALTAERTRLDAVSSNLANINTTRDETGAPSPYRPRFVVLAADESMATSGAAGVRVAEIGQEAGPPRLEYEPGHPDADPQGYVAYPNIDMTTEFVDAMQASRVYEANAGVIEITKDLFRQSLRILA